MSLKEIRESKGIKSKDVAAALGVSRSTLSMWETGKRKVRGSNLVKLSKLYKIPVARLVKVIFIEDMQGV